MIKKTIKAWERKMENYPARVRQRKQPSMVAFLFSQNALVGFLIFLSSCNMHPIPTYASPAIDLNIIAQIESNNNPNAWNYETDARGTFQITEICLREYNQFICPEYNVMVKCGFSMADLFDPVINYNIAHWYLTERIPQMLRYYKKPITIDNILWAYNAGIGKLVKGICPKETINYIKKYHKLEKQK